VTRWVALAAVLALPSAADAGGLARPNGGSPRGIGMAGAFGAIADDATCLHANPAGCAYATPGALAALELVVAPRSYVPVDEDGNRGESQDATAIAPAPVVGILFRPGGADSPVTLGVGAWNTYGGILDWEPDPAIPAINASTELVFELAAGASWAIDDRVSVGGGLRIGLGLFAVEAHDKPIGGTDSDLSASGIGVGVMAGILVRPVDALAIGLAWRSNLDVSTTGSGEILQSGTLRMVAAEHVQPWPQSASVSAAVAATDALVVAAQLDWTQWSRWEALNIHFPGNDGLDALAGTFPLDWHDAYAVRLGVQYAASHALAVRGGAYYDGNAIPDSTIERQYLDAHKLGVSAGLSIALGDRLILDVALDAVGGPARVVPRTTHGVAWPTQRNVAPGDHAGQVFTLASGLRIAL
jgi:long-chain fatty acid transport protein